VCVFDSEHKSYIRIKVKFKNGIWEGNGKECVTIISNSRKNVRPIGIVVMVSKSLIRFDKQVIIQKFKEEKALSQNTHSVIFIKIVLDFYSSFAPPIYK